MYVSSYVYSEVLSRALLVGRIMSSIGGASPPLRSPGGGIFFISFLGTLQNRGRFSRLSTRVRILFLIPAVRRMVVA